MLKDLVTESSSSRSAQIDRLSTAELLRVINHADREVPEAVSKELTKITLALDEIVSRLRNGGRLFYQGAGTSGRLGVLDASECPPTFGVDASMVQGVIAGGDKALRNSIERAEDDPGQGARDLAARSFTEGDALVGIAASGRTPYVLGGVEYARKLGALTVGLSCVPGSELARLAEIAITPVVGPEVITGSSRMKAGTATKLVLNMLSTGAMVRLGYVYGNLRVNVQPTNEKLVDRAERIIAAVAGVDGKHAKQLLAEAGSVQVAVVMQRLGVSRQDAERRLRDANGSVRAALGE